MKSLKWIACVSALVILLASTANATLLDSFSVDSSGDYTQWTVLDNGNDHDTSASDSTFTVSGGTATVVTAVADDVEQTLWRHKTTSLAVGEELQVDVISLSSDNRDLGLFVGNAANLVEATSANANTRANFIYITTGSSEASNGFDGAGSQFGSAFGVGVTDGDTLFIARTDATTYEVGHYDNDDSDGNGAGARDIRTTWAEPGNDTSGIDGSALGFWTDIRAAGTLSQFDDLRIIPEPTSLALGLLGVAALAVRREQ